MHKKESKNTPHTSPEKAHGGLLSALGSGVMEQGNKKSSLKNRNLKPLTHIYDVNLQNAYSSENGSQDIYTKSG